MNGVRISPLGLDSSVLWSNLIYQGSLEDVSQSSLGLDSSALQSNLIHQGYDGPPANLSVSQSSLKDGSQSCQEVELSAVREQLVIMEGVK